jgi:hypothetical protein
MDLTDWKVLRFVPPLASIALIGLAAWGFGRRAPRRPPGERSDLEAAALRRGRRDIDRATALPSLFFVALAVVGVTALLLLFANLRDRLMPAHLFLIHPLSNRLPVLVWVLPGLLTGVVIGTRVTEWYRVARFGRQAAENYREASRLAYRWDMERAVRWATAGVVLVCAGYIVLAMDWYTRFEEERVVLDPFWGLGETAYGYDRVTHLVHTTHVHTREGDVVRPQVSVVFADGERWTLDDDDDYDARPLFAFLQQKTGRTVQFVRLIEDVKP